MARGAGRERAAELIEEPAQTLDSRAFSWTNPVLNCYVHDFASVSSLFSGNSAVADDWQTTIRRVVASRVGVPTSASVLLRQLTARRAPTAALDAAARLDHPGHGRRGYGTAGGSVRRPCTRCSRRSRPCDSRDGSRRSSIRPRCRSSGSSLKIMTGPRFEARRFSIAMPHGIRDGDRPPGRRGPARSRSGVVRRRPCVEDSRGPAGTDRVLGFPPGHARASLPSGHWCRAGLRRLDGGTARLRRPRGVRSPRSSCQAPGRFHLRPRTRGPRPHSSAGPPARRAAPFHGLRAPGRASRARAVSLLT